MQAVVSDFGVGGFFIRIAVKNRFPVYGYCAAVGKIEKVNAAKQRCLPLPDEPIIESTSPFSREKPMLLSTSVLLKLFYVFNL